MQYDIKKIILSKAVQYLAQRDYSEQELTQKLTRIFSDKPNTNDSLESSVQFAIEYCLSHHWLDDKVYTQKYIEMRSRKGYGRYKIIFELKNKGVDEEIIDFVFDQINIDWIGLATYQSEKKFKNLNANDDTQRYKLMQFLRYRGFTHEEIQQAMSELKN